MPNLKKDREKEIPISYINECLLLNCDTGVLYWKVRPLYHFKTKAGFKNFSKQFAGKEAGTKSEDGYVRIWILGRQLLGHRVVFAITNSQWPSEEVDHIDRDRTNNRPNNLRIAGPLLNSWNHGIRNTNTSGVTGVTWVEHAKSWRAIIVSNGVRRHIGYFKDIEKAAEAYKMAEEKYRGQSA